MSVVTLGVCGLRSSAMARGGIVAVAAMMCGLAAIALLAGNTGRTSVLLTKDASLGHAESLRHELSASVQKQHMLGNKVKALVAASQMRAAHTASLAEESVSEIDKLQEKVSEQRQLIKELEAKLHGEKTETSGKEEKVSNAAVKVQTAVQAKSETAQSPPAVAATKQAPVVRVEQQPVEEGVEGIWNDEAASSDDTFDMGTNMAFLGQQVQHAKTASSARAKNSPPSTHVAHAVQDAKQSETKSESQGEEKQAAAAVAAPQAEDEEAGDNKPSLGSFDLAKFANNVDFGTGALGTNVVWMYKDLAKKGPYKQVEGDTDEYAAARTTSLAQQTTMLALNQGWNTPFVNPYIPPRDLYIYWGKSSATGTVASQLIGGAGRASSAQRVRQILKFGTFAGNHYVDDVSGHGHFLRTLEGQQFAGLSLRCCVTLLVPPMENDLPLYAENNVIARRIRDFVANGNTLIMTGGDYSSLVFMNKYFHYEIKKTILDEGPFERLAEKHLPSDAQGKWNKVARTLPQSGMSVTSVRKKSLPSGAKLIYATPFSTPLFQLTYCQAEIDHSACKIAQSQGRSCLRDALESECPAVHRRGLACSCGHILYIGYDFVDHHVSTIGRSVWDETLRAAVSMRKMGKPGPGVFSTSE